MQGLTADELDVHWDSDGTQSFSSESDIDDLTALWSDNSTFNVWGKHSNPLEALFLGLDFKLCFQTVFVDQLDLHGLRMGQEHLFKVEILFGPDVNRGSLAPSFDGNCEHILSDTFQIDNENHVIVTLLLRHEFYHDLSRLVLLKPTSIVLDCEL